jgi:hypothetical protein
MRGNKEAKPKLDYFTIVGKPGERSVEAGKKINSRTN